MSKIFRRSNCQKASDGTDGVNRWRYRRHFGRADRLATPGAVHIRLLVPRVAHCAGVHKRLTTLVASLPFYEIRSKSRTRGTRVAWPGRSRPRQTGEGRHWLRVRWIKEKSLASGGRKKARGSRHRHFRSDSDRNRAWNPHCPGTSGRRRNATRQLLYFIGFLTIFPFQAR